MLPGFIYLLCLPALDKIFEGRDVLFTIDLQYLEQGKNIVNVKQVFIGQMNKFPSSCIKFRSFFIISCWAIILALLVFPRLKFSSLQSTSPTLNKSGHIPPLTQLDKVHAS